MVSLIRINQKLFSLAVLVAMITSCQTEDVFYNHDAAPPKEVMINFIDLKQGQHVDGVVTINFTPESTTPEIVSILVLVDSVVVNELYNNNNNTFTFEINTRQWVEGSHKISIGVVKDKAPEIGLLNLLGYPYKFYSIDVVFDRTPATAVTLESVVWSDNSKSPVLTWTKNSDPNFYAYIIYRKDKSTIYEAGRIYNQNQVSIADTWNNGAIGFTFTYYIGVSNRYQSVASNEIIFSYPSAAISATPETLTAFIHPIIAKTRQEMYVLETNSIKTISTTTNQVVRTYFMGNQYPINFALSKDESKLYVVSTYSPKLTILDASNFTVINTAELAFSASAVICGRTDRLYVTTSWPTTGPVKILDATNGSEIGEVGVAAPNGLLAISSDNNTLYVAAPSATVYQTAKVYKADITTDNPQLLLEKDASDWVRAIQLSDDDHHLFLIHDFDYPAPLNSFVDFWEVNSFTSIRKFMIPRQAFDFSANSSSLFILSGERTLQYFSPGQVIEYNLSTSQITNTWNFLNAPRLIQVSPDNTVLYINGDSFWSLTL